jgi:hypothetical protein
MVHREVRMVRTDAGVLREPVRALHALARMSHQAVGEARPEERMMREPVRIVRGEEPPAREDL